MTFLLHHLLTKSAQKQPEKEAIRFQGEGLSYARLDELSDQLARTLQNAGIKPGDRVGLYVHKSFASIIGVFGIMKAGGVYVPLDPNAPAPRLAYITRSCDIKVLVTATNKFASLLAFFTEGTPINLIILTDSNELDSIKPLDGVGIIQWGEVLAENEAPEDAGIIENDLAYILYTSGSTGNPKGVMISHRTIFTFVNWGFNEFRMTPEDRVTSHAPLHFDLSTFDIYATIKAGGTIILIPEKLSVFPVQLVKLLQDEAITITYMVPSILSMMVNYGKLDAYDLAKLRTILFAGEVFPIKYLRKLTAAIPHAEYYNLYGPTETNVCTYYKVQEKDVTDSATQPVPIGKACANMGVFAVSEKGEIVTEKGVEGELWARGSCVAQGYWGNEEKTAQGFVQNPFQTQYDDRIYRTGDIVVLDKDGINWRFVGRRDHMIKSRGYRIELGEIEAALYGHAGIKEAAVIAIPDELVGNRLKAFVVMMEENGLASSDLKAHCRKQLPSYMVPEAIEIRDQLPKTSTGKINRPLLAKIKSASHNQGDQKNE